MACRAIERFPQDRRVACHATRQKNYRQLAGANRADSVPGANALLSVTPPPGNVILLLPFAAHCH
jgi:hypothetical protein